MSAFEKQKQQLQNTEKAKIHAETARTRWQDIALFYAKGQMIHVSETLDLIDVAHRLSIDDNEQIEQWINADLLQRGFDELAKTWADSEEELWTVVVKPWVLVQTVNKTLN